MNGYIRLIFDLKKNYLICTKINYEHVLIFLKV
jgi:hypothetical protein